MSSIKSPKVLWSPHAPYQALIGNNDLRLYEYIEPKNANKKPRLAMVAINTDIPLVKCFDWSHDPATADILAVGQSTGKTSLVKWHPARRFALGATASGGLEPTGPSQYEDFRAHEASLDGTATTILTLNVRHSRACNAVAFSYTAPHRLATGLEKVRNDYSLLIWDLHSLPAGKSQETIAPNQLHNDFSPLMSPIQPLKAGNDSVDFFSTRSLPLPRAMPLSNCVDEPPTLQYFSSEAVLSLAWLPSSSSELLVGLGLKRIRLIDIRDSSSANSSTIFSTKAVYGIQVDPFHHHRFISYAEDGLIKLWDRRKATQPVLSFNTECRSSNITVQFSPVQPNRIATLERDDNQVKVWSLAESTENSDGTIKPLPSVNQSLLLSGQTEAENLIPHPIVWKTRQTIAAAQNLAAFSWIPPSLSLRNQQELIILAKDGTTDILSLREPISMAWSSLGHIITAEPIGLCIHGPHLPVGAFIENAPEPVNQVGSTKRATPAAAHADLINNSHYSHSVGPRSSLSTRSKKQSLPVARPVLPPEFVLTDSDIDISAIMATRAQMGYTMDPANNINLCPGIMSLQEVWDWVAKMKLLFEAGHTKTDSFDYAFQSLNVILNTSTKNSIFLRKGSQSTLSMPRFSTNVDPSMIQPGDSHETPEVSLSSTLLRKTPSYPTERQRASANFSSSRPMGKLRRKALALEMLLSFSTPLINVGTNNDYSEGIFQSESAEKIIQTYEKKGDIEQAVFFSLILISLKRAYEILQKSNSERYQLMATALSARISNSQNCQEEWQSQCYRMAIALSEPHLQAVFLYAWKESWFDVLEVSKLPLRHRLIIAVKFLEGEDLKVYLNTLSSELVTNGDLSGLILIGLASSQSLELLGNYVDHTSDIQTAALLFSHGAPFFKQSDLRGQVWIENYRMLLDRWKMWHTRCSWDIARRSHAQKVSISLSAMSQGNNLDRQERIPPHVAVRCNFCNANIGPSLPSSNIGSSPGSALSKTKRINPTTGANAISASLQSITTGNNAFSQKSTCCPNCKKPLPRCALCLLHLGTPVDPSSPATTGLFPSMAISNTVPDLSSNIANNQQADPRSPNSPHSTRLPLSGSRTNQENTSGNAADTIKDSTLAQSFNFWFSWCQTCRHGGHVAHMAQWFSRHSQCPVADCKCLCTIH